MRRVTFTTLAPPPTELVGHGDVVAQAEQVLANLVEQLAAVGSDLVHVVASTVHVASADRAVLAQVWDVLARSAMSRESHSSTLVGVSCLGYPGQLVEITATAVVAEAIT